MSCRIMTVYLSPFGDWGQSLRVCRPTVRNLYRKNNKYYDIGTVTLDEFMVPFYLVNKEACFSKHHLILIENFQALLTGSFVHDVLILSKCLNKGRAPPLLTF